MFSSVNKHSCAILSMGAMMATVLALEVTGVFKTACGTNVMVRNLSIGGQAIMYSVGIFAIKKIADHHAHIEKWTGIMNNAQSQGYFIRPSIGLGQPSFSYKIATLVLAGIATTGLGLGISIIFANSSGDVA